MAVSKQGVGPQDPTQRNWWHLGAAIVIVLAGILAYANSFSVPFLLDDELRIINNPQIHQVWPLSRVFADSSRPLINLTLALNYQFGELEVWGYHAVNLGIHILAALVLYGLVWRSLRQRFAVDAQKLGLTVALLWVVHPLTTQAVTYVIQRAESLMGLWYLLTLYGLLRAVSFDPPAAGPAAAPPRHPSSATGRPFGIPPTRGLRADGWGPRLRVTRGWWLSVSVASCWLGMATKPVMVTAPLLALLLDRTFLSGSFRAAWRARWNYYVGLCASWGLLTYLLITGAEDFTTTAGLDLEKISFGRYALTQPAVLLHYLRLSFWPHPLAFDYGWPPAQHVTEVLLPGLGFAMLLGWVIWLWRRQPAIGFWAWWILLMLAPTSLIPIADLAFEYRMYLPVAGAIALAALGAHALLRRLIVAVRLRRWVAVGILLLTVGAFGTLTFRRNLDYQSEIRIWQDTVVKRPDSIRALSNLGAALVAAGQPEDAMRYLSQVLERKPDHVKAIVNMGSALILVQHNDMDKAVEYFKEALRLNPASAEAHHNLGTALAKQGQFDEALVHYRQAAKLRPNFAEAYYNIGRVLAQQHQLADAETNYRMAVKLDPRSLDVWYNLGNTLVQLNKSEEAVRAYSEVIRLSPRSAEAHEAHNNLGNVWFRQGKLEEALRSYTAALQLQSDSAQAHNNMGMVLARLGQVDEAAAHFSDALRLNPEYAEAHNNLGNALAQRDQLEDAVAHYRRAIELKSDYADAYNNLGVALARIGQFAEAAEQLAEAIRLKPEYTEARENLAAVQQQLTNQPTPSESHAQ